MYHYIKHSYVVLGFIPATAILVLTAPAMAFVAPLLICLFHLVLDLGTSRDHSVPEYRATFILDFLLYLQLPATLVCLASLLWLVSPGDLGGFGAWFAAQTGNDILQTKASLTLGSIVSAAFAVGFILSTNTIVAHELVHRTTDRLAMFIGRWLLAEVGDAQFSLSHVYGHHVNVSTDHDPATARRGDNLYGAAWRSALGQYKESWAMESKRLSSAGFLGSILRNKVLSGLAMTLCFAAVFVYYAGMVGLVAYAIVALVSKMLFEGVNYIEHYGLVRVPGTMVEPRHSWDCNNRAASNILLNLTRHSHHHADARVKYWALRPMTGSLELPFGYIAHISMAFVPPLWHRFAAPHLERWDNELASPAERQLAAKANAASQHWLYKFGH